MYTKWMGSVVTVTTARKNLLSLVDETDQLYKRFVITKNGVDKAVLMSAAEFEGWVETLMTLSDAKSMSDIKETEKAIKTNKLLSFESVTRKISTKRK